MLQFLTLKVCVKTNMFFDISREYANLDQNDLSHLERFDLQEIFLSITNLILTGKQGGKCCNFWQRWLSLERHICFINSAELASLEHSKPISILKHLSCKKFSFQKLTQFSQGSNVLDALASNTDGFPLRDICVTSTWMNRPVLRKWTLIHLENSDLLEVFLSNTS
jgi:hypothetical protein